MNTNDSSEQTASALIQEIRNLAKATPDYCHKFINHLHHYFEEPNSLVGQALLNIGADVSRVTPKFGIRLQIFSGRIPLEFRDDELLWLASLQLDSEAGMTWEESVELADELVRL